MNITRRNREFIERYVYGAKKVKEIYILAEAYRHAARIHLYEGGHSVSALLHEVAHFMPGGHIHGKAWQKNFLKLIKWYNDNWSWRLCNLNH